MKRGESEKLRKLLCPPVNNHLLLALMEALISPKPFLIGIFCVYEEGIFFSPGNTILHFL